MPEESTPVVYLSTAPTPDDALRLSRLLVEQQLAACVNIVPGATSVYRWNGALEESQELVLIIKSRAEHADAIATVLKQEHPYELPECIMLPIQGGSDDYLNWIRQETHRSTPG